MEKTIVVRMWRGLLDEVFIDNDNDNYTVIVIDEDTPEDDSLYVVNKKINSEMKKIF